MTIESVTNALINLPARILGSFHDLVALALRGWVGLQFFQSGLLKLGSWENTQFLFREEYHVPLLPSNLAAVVGTAGEIVFPILLWLGLFGRLSALGMSLVNIMAVVAYAHVLLSPGFEAAIGQHTLWGLALLVLIVYGPGRYSLDGLINHNLNRSSAHKPVSQAI